MKKVIILCICTILSGALLFTYSCFFIADSTPVFGWCIGLSSALIILGLGYLLNVLIKSAADKKNNLSATSKEDEFYDNVKERAGYLVCKIMNVLLCIYLLVLNKLGCEPIIMILGILIVLLQFFLDLFIQVYLSNRKSKK